VRVLEEVNGDAHVEERMQEGGMARPTLYRETRLVELLARGGPLDIGTSVVHL